MPLLSAAARIQPPDWLRNAGFRFDPFEHLEASTDPYLGEYLVGLTDFSVAWDNTPALIFAPAGGGKTSMRIYTARTCWTSFGDSHPFPNVYEPHPRAAQAFPGTLEDHLAGITTAAAVALLLGLASKPERLLELDQARRVRVAALLQDALPGSLARYVHVLRESASPRQLAALLDRSFPAIDPPSEDKLEELCDMLGHAVTMRTVSVRPPSATFAEMMELLLDDLGYRSVFLLIDGVDGLPETIESPAAAWQWLAPLLDRLTPWAAQRIYIKGFLPVELETVVFPATSADGFTRAYGAATRRVTIQWNPALLADVIRRRVYVATDGDFGSLDAISSPELRDVETTLARIPKPLPRELIWLVNQLLSAAAQRTGGELLRLEQDDVTRVAALYANRLAVLNPFPEHAFVTR